MASTPSTSRLMLGILAGLALISVQPVRAEPPALERREPRPLTGPAGEELPPPDQPSQPNVQQSAASSLRERALVDAAERFGKFAPVGDLTIEIAISSGTHPTTFEVAPEAAEVAYLSPPAQGQRNWAPALLGPFGYCHQPLYFEDANLERYGRTRGLLQPACSAAHFFGTAMTMPYRMTAMHPLDCYRHHHPYLSGTNGCEYQVRQLKPGPLMVQLGVAAGMLFGLPLP